MYYITFLLSIVLMLFGSFVYMNGVHSQDLAQNLKYIETEFDIELYDMATDYALYTFDEIYIMGINQQKVGLFFLIPSIFLIGAIWSISQPNF